VLDVVDQLDLTAFYRAHRNDGPATDVGVAMSMPGLFALAGPAIGSFANRYRAFRAVQALGVLGIATLFAILALSVGDSFLIVLAVAA
jgi:hypothetical protein